MYVLGGVLYSKTFPHNNRKYQHQHVMRVNYSETKNSFSIEILPGKKRC